MKKIRIGFSDFWAGYNYEDNEFINGLRKHYDVEISSNPEILIYSIWGNDFLKYKNCVKVFFTGEILAPDFNECDYGISFPEIEFGDRYISSRGKWTYYDKIMKREQFDSSEMFNRKFCNFYYSNAHRGEGAKIRIDFCKRLAEYKHIDCPGAVLHNMPDNVGLRTDWRKYLDAIGQKLDIVKNYKFTIAFENAIADDYITEKLTEPMIVGSIPIYYGAPNVGDYYNTKAFINCNDFSSFDDVIDRVRELDCNKQAYMDMLMEKPVLGPNVFDYESRVENFLVNIVENGMKKYAKDEDYIDRDIKKRTELAEIKKENGIYRDLGRSLSEITWA